MLIIITAAIIIGELLGILLVWYGAKDDEGSTAARRVVWTSAVICVCNVLLNFYGVDLQTPVCMASEDYDGIIFESQQREAMIEYSLSTGDADKIEWITYHDGDIVPIERDPTTIRFRAYYILKRGDIQQETAHIDPYGRVYTAIEPEPTFTTIVADYKLRNAEPGKAGNAYEGYTLKEEDFAVRGIDVGGEEVPIDSFTFEPDKLSYGKNEITIRYTTVSKQDFVEAVVVQANHPALVSMDASLSSELNGRVLPGTVLTPDMFSVEGTYEDGHVVEIDSFEISPAELEAEGSYLVAISRDGVTAETEVIATNEIPVSDSEDEPNNELGQATRINVNSRYSGKVSEDTDDVDYYRFQLARKGKAWINFRHDKFDNSYKTWDVDLLQSQDDSTLLSMESSAATAELDSSPTRLASGTYYLRVSGYGGEGDMDYTFLIGFAAENEFFEAEPNDDYGASNEIDLDAAQAYTGNLSHSHDYDFYKLVLPQKARVDVSLAHAKVDSSYTYWVMSVLDGVDDQTIAETDVHGDSAVTSLDPFRLPAGTYYIRIKPNSWDDIDYELSVQCQYEDDGAETEPNDDFTSASFTSLGTWMTGNMQSHRDRDFFAFTCDGTGSASLTFKHVRSDSDYRFWRVTLHGDSSDAIRNTDDSQSLDVQGNDPEEVRCTWTGLKAGGKYYLKVETADSHDSSDYRIRLD